MKKEYRVLWFSILGAFIIVVTFIIILLIFGLCIVNRSINEPDDKYELKYSFEVNYANGDLSDVTGYQHYTSIEKCPDDSTRVFFVGLNR